MQNFLFLAVTAFSRDPYHSKSKVEKKREIREDEKMTRERERDSHGENERGNGRNETVNHLIQVVIQSSTCV